MGFLAGHGWLAWLRGCQQPTSRRKRTEGSKRPNESKLEHMQCAILSSSRALDDVRVARAVLPDGSLLLIRASPWDTGFSLLPTREIPHERHCFPGGREGL